MNIKDIARLSGVGVSTVSRVLNNHPDVKLETRENVLRIIKEKNYIPNNSARILKKSNTKNIGVLVKGVFNPFFSEMLSTISAGIIEAGYTMILQHYENDGEQDVDNLIAFIKEKRLQGVICLGGNFLEVKEDNFQDIDVPVVLTSVHSNPATCANKFSTIGIQNDKAAYDAIEYLISKGHKNIGFMLGVELDIGIGYLRLKGYKEALKAHGIAYREDYIYKGNYEFEKSYNETLRMLEEHKDITAIFVISDIMAIGSAKAIISKGLTVGKDISIMGFDGMDLAKYYNPSISTMKQPRQEMANLSVEMLMNLINGKGAHKHILLNTELIERESCGDI